MKTGKLQRRWSAERPLVYDKVTRTVCLDIVNERNTDEEGNELYGFSYIPVEIDSHIDYGHVKSQLIEAGFAQKDEFGLLMNAVEGIVAAISSADSWETFKSAVDVEDIKAFTEFCAFRAMCADAAKEVMNNY